MSRITQAVLIGLYIGAAIVLIGALAMSVTA